MLKKITKVEFEEAMNNTRNVEEIESLLIYMDAHLSLLSIALKEDNVEAVDFQKSQLDFVRNKLVGLEYFKTV